MDHLKAKIREIPDFPKKGILFKDITTLLKEPAAFKQAIDDLTARVRHYEPEAVIGMESRGFIFAAPLALELQKPFVLVRKPGKLPFDKHSCEYDLEYGSNVLELHTDALQAGDRVEHGLHARVGRLRLAAHVELDQLGANGFDRAVAVGEAMS